MSEAEEILAQQERDEQKQTIRRREFLAQGTGVAALTAAILVGAGVGIRKFMLPIVSYMAPRKFHLRLSDLPAAGNELVFPEQRVILRRHEDGRVSATSLVCTHLGCTVYRVPAGFQCPCHGSQYDDDGIVVGGPAPKPLAWLAMKPMPGETLEIDTGSRLPEGTFFDVG